MLLPTSTLLCRDPVRAAHISLEAGFGAIHFVTSDGNPRRVYTILLISGMKKKY